MKFRLLEIKNVAVQISFPRKLKFSFRVPSTYIKSVIVICCCLYIRVSLGYLPYRVTNTHKNECFSKLTTHCANGQSDIYPTLHHTTICPLPKKRTSQTENTNSSCLWHDGQAFLLFLILNVIAPTNKRK